MAKLKGVQLECARFLLGYTPGISMYADGSEAIPAYQDDAFPIVPIKNLQLIKESQPDIYNAYQILIGVAEGRIDGGEVKTQVQYAIQLLNNADITYLTVENADILHGSLEIFSERVNQAKSTKSKLLDEQLQAYFLMDNDEFNVIGFANWKWREEYFKTPASLKLDADLWSSFLKQHGYRGNAYVTPALMFGHGVRKIAFEGKVDIHLLCLPYVFNAQQEAAGKPRCTGFGYSYKNAQGECSYEGNKKYKFLDILKAYAHSETVDALRSYQHSIWQQIKALFSKTAKQKLKSVEKFVKAVENASKNNTNFNFTKELSDLVEQNKTFTIFKYATEKNQETKESKAKNDGRLGKILCLTREFSSVKLTR